MESLVGFFFWLSLCIEVWGPCRKIRCVRVSRMDPRSLPRPFDNVDITLATVMAIILKKFILCIPGCQLGVLM